MDTVEHVEQRADLREMEQRLNDVLTQIAKGQEVIASAILAIQDSLARFDAMAELVGQMFPQFASQPELVIPQPGDEEDASS